MFELVIHTYYFQYGNFKYKQNEHIQQKKKKQDPVVSVKKNLFD